MVLNDALLWALRRRAGCSRCRKPRKRPLPYSEVFTSAKSTPV